MAGAQEIQHMLKNATMNIPLFFDNGTKPHYVKVEATLAAYAHLNRRSAMFGERRVGAF